MISEMMTGGAPRGRIQSLDGLRGIAAFIVVVMHFLCTFFPDLVFGSHGAQGNEWQDTLSRSPLFVLWNGSFAVYIFFVLSGFVIAASASGSRAPLPLLIGRRYLRLTLPALASTLAAFILLQTFPGETQRLAAEMNNGWLVKYYGRELNGFYAFIDGVFNPYRYGEVYANFVLWTMRYELFGSLSLYLIYRLCPAQWRVWLLTLLLISLVPQDAFLAGFIGFAAGALIYEAYRSGIFKTSRPRLALPLCIIGVGLGALPQQPAEQSYFAPLVGLVGQFSSPPDFLYGLGAILLLLGCLSSQAILSFLAIPVFRFLGRISFGLYLVHWPLLALPFIGLYYYWAPFQSEPGFALFSALYFVTVMVLAYAFTLLVDEPVIANLKRVQINQRWRSRKLFFVVHALIFIVFVMFVISRLGLDLAALLVWLIAYSGFVVITMRIHDLVIPERAEALA